MAKIKDVLGPAPEFRINEHVGDPIDPTKIRANYDAESDSIIIFLTGKSQPTVSVYTDEGLYLMVDPKDRKLVGFHIENWEKVFVPAHAEIREAWSPIRKAQAESQPWEMLLRMMALWTVSVLRTETGTSSALQPA